MEIDWDGVVASIAHTLASIILQIVVLFLSTYPVLPVYCTDSITTTFLFLLILGYFLTILFAFSSSIGTLQLHFITIGTVVGDYIF